MIWSVAEAQAVADGGYLASIDSAADQTFIDNTFLTPQTSPAPVWVGFHDPHIGDGGGPQHAQDFQWANGDSVTAYTNWFPGELNNSGGGEYYTAINWQYTYGYGGDPGEWNDYNVNGSYAGLIETSAIPTQPDGAFQLGSSFFSTLSGVIPPNARFRFAILCLFAYRQWHDLHRRRRHRSGHDPDHREQ